MKYLVSVPADKSIDGKWTTRQEPVVPCFPSQHSRAFITVPEFRLAEKAVVTNTDADPDKMVEALAKEYPSLPRKLHENYVMAVFKAAFDLKEGTVLTVGVNQKQAFLIRADTRETITLWNEQPMS